MSEPKSAAAIEERAFNKSADDEVDALTARIAATVRAALPPGVGFALVIGKMRQHYIHTCLAADDPMLAPLLLSKGLEDLRDAVRGLRFDG